MCGEQKPPDNNKQTKCTYEEIRMMINLFIQLGYRREIAFWRRILQAARNSSRRMDYS